MSPTLYNAFDRALRVELGPSRLLGTVWLLLNGIAAGGLLYVSPDWRWRLGLLTLVSLYALLGYLLHVSLALPWSVRALAWDPQRGWKVRFRSGSWLNAELCTPVLVSEHLTAMRLRLPRWRYVRVLVVADRTASADFRRLRVRLLQSARGDRDRAKIPGSQ
jgi:hypothetical protein